MALELEKSNHHQVTVNACDRISIDSIDLESEEISNVSNFEFESDDDFSNSNCVYERAISTNQLVLESKTLPTIAFCVENNSNSQTKRFLLCKKLSSFIRALWLCGIATTYDTEEKMDDNENAPSNENSQASHKDEVSEFKFKLFSIEQVECDRK